MIWLPDVNVLVAAAVARDPKYAVSKAWLDDALSTGEVALLTEAVAGFVRIMSLPTYGVAPAASIAWIEGIVATGRADYSRPSHGQFRRFRTLAVAPGVHGRDATDAMIAAAALDLDATLVTWDVGFSRFPGLRWLRPGEGQAVTNPR